MEFDWDPAKNEANLNMTISRKRMKKIEAIGDKDIDYGDIPETDADFWADAKLIEPDRTQHVTLRIKKSVLDHFKAEGTRGYQTRMNAVLESYVRAQEKNRDRQPRKSSGPVSRGSKTAIQ